MIVTNIGYMKLNDVLKLKQFSIYETHKKTHVLVKYTSEEKISLFHPKKNRLPWKVVNGNKICHGIKIFDSTTDELSNICIEKWNNGNQIMAYEEFLGM